MIPRRLPLLLLALAGLRATADPQVDAMRQYNSGLLRQRLQDRGLTVRDRACAEQPSARAEMLLFCRQKQVTTLFVDVDALTGSAALRPDQLYGWRRLVADAHRQGLTVYAVCGNTGWIENRGPALDAIERLAAFCRAVQAGERFDGVLLDFPLFSELQRLYAPPEELEPPAEEELVDGVTERRDANSAYQGVERGERPDALPPGEAPDVPSTDQIFSTSSFYDRSTTLPVDLKNREMLRQYLTVIKGLIAYIGRRHAVLGWRVGVVFPAWLRVNVGFDNQIKLVDQHFLDLADFAVVHNMPGEVTDIGRASDGVLMYASRAGKPVYLRLDLAYPKSVIPELLSLFGRDELFLEDLVTQLLTEQGRAPGFGGVVLDDYHGYRSLPAVREVPADPRLPMRRDQGPPIDERAPRE